MNEIQCAVVGCGSIAKVHAAALQKTPGARMVACADIKLERAEALASQYGAKAYASLESMLDSEDIQALHICTPHYLHERMAKAAAARGLSVFCEKPPAISRAQWESMRDTARKTRVGVCFQNRYNPCVMRAKELIASGDAGRVLGARAFVTWKREAPYYTESGWRGAWETEGGGALMNQSVHTLDLLCHLLGKPAAVEASMRNHHLKGVIEVEDTVEAYIRFGSAPALFYATTAYCDDAPVYVEIVCENMTLALTGMALTIRHKDGREERPTFAQEEALGKGYWGNGHVPCIRAFYQSIRDDAPAPLGVADVAETMELLLEIYASTERT